MHSDTSSAALTLVIPPSQHLHHATGRRTEAIRKDAVKEQRKRERAAAKQAGGAAGGGGVQPLTTAVPMAGGGAYGGPGPGVREAGGGAYGGGIGLGTAAAPFGVNLDALASSQGYGAGPSQARGGAGGGGLGGLGGEEDDRGDMAGGGGRGRVTKPKKRYVPGVEMAAYAFIIVLYKVGCAARRSIAHTRMRAPQPGGAARCSRQPLPA